MSSGSCLPLKPSGSCKSAPACSVGTWPSLQCQRNFVLKFNGGMLTCAGWLLGVGVGEAVSRLSFAHVHLPAGGWEAPVPSQPQPAQC